MGDEFDGYGESPWKYMGLADSREAGLPEARPQDAARRPNSYISKDFPDCHSDSLPNLREQL